MGLYKDSHGQEWLQLRAPLAFIVLFESVLKPLITKVAITILKILNDFFIISTYPKSEEMDATF